MRRKRTKRLRKTRMGRCRWEGQDQGKNKRKKRGGEEHF